MKRSTFFGLLGKSAAIAPVIKRGQAPGGYKPPIFEPVAGPAFAPRAQVGAEYLVNQNPDQSELIFRALNIKGALPKHIEPKFDLALQVEDWTRPEFWWLKRGQTATIGDSVAAVAAQQGFVDISFAPNRMAIIDSMIIANTAAVAQNFRIGVGTPVAAGTIVPKEVRDDRCGAAGTGSANQVSAVITSGTNAAPVVGLNDIVVATTAGQTLTLPINYVMTGRVNLHVVSLALNAQFAAWFLMRERELLQTET